MGTDAIKKLEDNIAEIKRLWLLEEYHSQRSASGCRTIAGFCVRKPLRKSLASIQHRQKRAISSYTQLEFQNIPSYHESMDDISIEIYL